MHLGVLGRGGEPLEGVVEHLLEHRLAEEVEHVRRDSVLVPGFVHHPGVDDLLDLRSLFRRDAPHLRVYEFGSCVVLGMLSTFAASGMP